MDNGANTGTTDGQSSWFENWKNSDTVYIDGGAEAPHNPTRSSAGYNGEGSGDGEGLIQSDTIHDNAFGISSNTPRQPHETGSGSHPSLVHTDDEDLDPAFHNEGSGDYGSERETTVYPYWMQTVAPVQPVATTTELPYWLQETSTTPYWMAPTDPPYVWQPATTEETPVHHVIDESEKDDFVTPPPPPPKVETTPRSESVPTDSNIYEKTGSGKSSILDPFLKPGILAAVIGGAVVGLLAAILLVMFIVYRMRKKDEGSYALDEPKAAPSYPYAYQKAPTKEFYA